MGEKITPSEAVFVAFKPASNGGFTAFLSMEGLGSLNRDPEHVLREAARVYERSIDKIRSVIIVEIKNCRAKHKRVSARTIWEVGERIYELKARLEELSLELDGLYTHLSRDLNVKRKWLEKVVILRRYLPKKDLIPETLNWGRCEKGTRRIAEKLRDGVPLA